MRNFFYLFIALHLISTNVFSQAPVQSARIMVIPFTKDGEDIRTVLDNDANRRLAITKVKEAFDNQGYTTVDFIGKLKSARDNQVFTSDNQSDIQSKIIEMSGCDIYVLTEVDVSKDNTGASVSVVLSSYEVATGNSLANKVGNSGKFYTSDISKLTTKAVENCMDDFVNTMNIKFAEIEKTGYSVLVDMSFAEDATVNMTTEIGNDKLALSDVLENWFSKNAQNGSYHIQGTTKLKMIFDDVKIPVRDQNGNIYTSNRFALELYRFLKSQGLNPAKQIKGNAIYITLN